MKQVIQSARTGKLGLKDVPAPKVKRGHVLVETRASLISAGTERMVVDFARKSLAGKAKARPDLVKKVLTKVKRDGLEATMRAVLARLDEPLPLGYSATGTVLAVGSGLEGLYQVGQRVAVAGAGLANHAEINAVPQNLVAPVPDGVSDEEACFGTMASIALHAVRNADVRLGEFVAVLGVGLLGQIAVQQLALSGARVLAFDYNPERLALAQSLGAEAGINLGESTVEETVLALTGGLGCDAVLISAATKSSEPFDVAAMVARDRARVVMVGMTGTEFNYAAFMKKELNLVVSRSYGPGRYDGDFEGRGVKYPVGWVRWTETDNLAECVRLMDSSLANRLDVGALITHRFAITEAEKAYQLVTEGSEPHLGVVLTYDEHDVKKALTSKVNFINIPASKQNPAEVVLGAIGAGNFARTVLLPRLKSMDGVALHTVATNRGASADHSAETFGFERAGTDPQAVLDAADINAVMIATRHETHAEITASALRAGKSVLVEKPLALTREQLNDVIEARNSTDSAFFQIGFNRRFAPMAIKMRDFLAAQAGPKFVVLRVNAGALPADTWINESAEGGGRILGEMCHFIDLARFFTGSPVVSVQADAAASTGVCDDLTVTLRCEDGSLATVAYTALGDTAYSKERFEGFCGGAVVTLDNFRKLTMVQGGKESTESSTLGQDKGFDAALDAFARAVRDGGPAPIHEDELVETSLATIAVLESLQLGQKVTLD